MSPLSQETRINPQGSKLSATPESELPPLNKQKKDKEKKASKGVETLFRTTMSNHMKLSEMADRKANLMISINAILISITISTYARKFDAPANLLIPSLLLLAVCLVTIIVSLLATNPTISPIKKRGNVEDERPIDLLFFGYYSQLSGSEYRQKLRTLLGNDDDLYNSLIDNIYAQGQVLSRKYRLLKFAYQFFMIGFSIVVISAVVALITIYYN